MDSTTKLQLPYLIAAQAQKHVTHNEALTLLDALVQLAVESRLLSAPPGSPAEGDCYIPAAGASGAWSGFESQLMAYAGGGWVRIVPKSGMKAWVKSERLTVTYEDGIWRDGAALSANGGRVTLRAKEEELTLSGAFTETADAAFIPDRAIVLAVASRTTLAVTGATSYGVGIAGEAGKFGDLLGIALGSSNVGAIGPAAFYADTKVRVTANGSNFTAGKVRLVCYFLEMSAPAGSCLRRVIASRHRRPPLWAAAAFGEAP